MKLGMSLILSSAFVFLVPMIGWTADEAVIQDLQSDVEFTKGKADANAAEIESLKGGLPAERAARELEDQLLWEYVMSNRGPTGPTGPPGPQGPQGDPGICESCGDLIPPTIEHNAPTESPNFEEEITFTLWDDMELSHYIIQGDTSAFIQLTSYFKPAVAVTTFTHTLGLHEGLNEFLMVAVDTQGNAGKSLIQIVFSPGTCGDGLLSPGEECDDGNNLNGDGCSDTCLIETDLVTNVTVECPSVTCSGITDFDIHISANDNGGNTVTDHEGTASVTYYSMVSGEVSGAAGGGYGTYVTYFDLSDAGEKYEPFAFTPSYECQAGDYGGVEVTLQVGSETVTGSCMIVVTE